MDDNPNDIGHWIQELTKRSAAEQMRAWQRYNELIQRISRGDLDDQAIREEYMRFAREESQHYARQITALSLQYYTDLVELYRSYTDHFFRMVFREADGVHQPETQAATQPRQVGMDLHAPSGEVAQGSFVLENKRTESTEISFMISEFIEAGGTTSFRPPLHIQPPRFKLGPREEAVVTLHLPMYRELFEPGKVYTATVVVRGYEDLELVLRVWADLEEEAEAVAIHPAPEEPTPSAKTEDDLTQLLGIGPSYAEKLRQDGIRTFKELMEANPERLAQVLGPAGKRLAERYQWQAQARLADRGDDAAFQELVTNLKSPR